MRVRFFQSAVVVTTLSLTGAASAHFLLKAPLPSNATDTSGGKGGSPCGPDAPSAVITSVTGGSQIAITVQETVFHPGHYRIALALNSRDEIDPKKPGGLLEPVVKNMQGMAIMTGDSFSADVQNPAVFPVLADGVFTHTTNDKDFTTMITLPNVNCDKCTLQVIEFMAQHPPDYFYHHCADLKITADPGKPIFTPGGGAGGSGAGGSAGGGVGGTASAGSSAGGNGTGGSFGGTGFGGTPGSAGTGLGGAPGSAAGGSAATAGGYPGAAGTGALPPAATSDDSGCSLSAPGRQSGTFSALIAGLVLGLGRLARRRNRSR